MRGSSALDLGRDNRLVALSLLLWGLGSGVYFYVWPIYVAALGAGPYEVGLLLALGGLSAIAGYVFGGAIESRFNWKSVLLAGWLVGTLATLDYGLADRWWALLPGVFLLNFSGFCDPSLSGYIGAASSRRDLGRVFTTVFAGFSLGMAVSPALGGWLSGFVGIRPLFFVSAALYALSTLALLPITPRRRSEGGTSAARFLEGRDVSFAAPLRDPDFRRLVGLLLVVFGSSSLGTALLPLFFQEQAGLPTGVVGGFGSIASLGGVVIALALGRWSDRAGIHRALAVTSALLIGCFVLALGAPLASGLSIPALYGVSAISNLLRGSSSAQTSLTRASVLAVLRPPIAGRGFAIQLIALGVAQTIGPYAAGALYASDPRLPLIVASALGAITATLLWIHPLARSPKS